MVAYRVALSHEQLSDKQTETGLFGTSLNILLTQIFYTIQRFECLHIPMNKL